MRKAATIIGAGIAGLSAGCYLQMNGYNTRIFELHSLPGGLCCAWKRKDYTIEGCIHWLAGSSPGDSIYKIWNELIDMQSLEFIYHDEHIRAEDKDGNFIRVFTDINKLEQEFLEKASEDAALIQEFTKAVRGFLSFVAPVDKAFETFTFIDRIKFLARVLPHLRTFKKWSKITIRDYADKYKNPLLKKALLHTFFPDMTVFFIILTLAWRHNKYAGYPLGGSLKLAQMMEQAYLNLGGEIFYNSKVIKIRTANDCATGIILESGQAIRSDIVISAADGYATIFDMLEGRYIDEQIKDYYNNYDAMPSYLQVSLGISRKLDNEPQSVVLPLERPLIIDEKKQHENILVRIFNNDPAIAPAGKSLITVLLTTPHFAHWENLRQNDKDKYQAEKERIANAVIEVLEKRFGNIKNHIEVIDVATPATVIRYTNNWKGSLEGWVLSPKMTMKKMRKVLPLLSNFYMAGQWVEPGGGISTSLISGRNVTQIICQDDLKKFRSSLSKSLV
jgi:phytoene dehydrogenase-like protein